MVSRSVNKSPNRCARAVLAAWLRGGSNPPPACAHLHLVVVFRASLHALGITIGMQSSTGYSRHASEIIGQLRVTCDSSRTL